MLIDRQSISLKFCDERFHNVAVIIGIEQNSINAILQILTIIDNITLEILFHILLYIFLPYDIVLGDYVLSDGLVVHMSSTTEIDKLCP